jgi:photosystem II stability/assembly factor-like uncharacterized protein
MPAYLLTNERQVVALVLVLAALTFTCNKKPTSGPAGPIMTLSTAQLNFFGAAGGGNPARQAVLVRNTGTDTLHFTVTHLQSWLDLTVVPGTGADTIFVYAYISGFTVGAYYDTITVSSNNAINSPMSIAVMATVQADVLVSHPVLLFQSLVNGPDPDTQNLSIVSTGANGVAFTVTKSQPWLTVSITNGSTPDDVSVGISNAGLNSGNYYDTVVITTASLVTPTIRVPVTLTARSWASFTISGSNDLRGVDILDDQTVLAVGFIGNVAGHVGVILKTTDAGKTWGVRKYVNYASLGGIDFIDKTHGWVVGDSGMILYTSDGGETWDQIPESTLPTHDTISLWRVKFADLARGWIIGVKGTLLRATDSGKTWVIQTTPSTFSLADIEMNSPTTGWIVGNHGTILHTIDGNNWLEQTSPTVRDLWAISMIDNVNGWIVGTNGEMLSTTDGGATWTLRPSGESTNLQDVFFVDATTGWAVGDFGIILRYQPATGTWWRQNSGTTRTLFNCGFTPSGYGVSVGELGTILLTYNGGL